MPPQSTGKRAALVLALLLSFATGASAVSAPRTNAHRAHARTKPRAAAHDCSSVTDAQIVRMIKHKIRTTPRLNATRKDISVLSNNHEVTLEGCTLNMAAIAQLVRYAKSLHCVTKVNNKLSVCNPHACLPGQTKCPDGECVARGQLCPPITKHK